MTRRWPLNIVMWKKNDGVLDPQKSDFHEVGDDFNKCRDLVCAKLNNEGFEAGMIGTDITTIPEEAARNGHKAEDMLPHHIELHYRAWDDAYRGRIVIGGLESREAMAEYVAELQKQYELKVFTANELYALRPINHVDNPDANIETRGYLGHLERWLQEENICLHDFRAWDKIEEAGLIKIKYLVNEYMGSDESFEIATVWFASNPIAVVTHTGEDNPSRYITDIAGWYKMVAYLRSFMEPEEEDKPTVVDADKPLYWLTEPDNYHTLHDFYDVKTQTKKEKITA